MRLATRPIVPVTAPVTALAKRVGAASTGQAELALNTHHADDEVGELRHGRDPEELDREAAKIATEEAELAAVIDRGRAEGKLTKHQADNWAKTQTVEGLAAFLEHAPVVVRRDEVKAEENSGASASVAALTPEEKAVAKTMGISEAEMLETKRARLAAQKGALGHDRTRSCAAAEEDRRAPAPGDPRGADGGVEDLAGRDRRREQLGLRRVGEHGRRPLRPRRRRRDEGQLGGRRR